VVGTDTSLFALIVGVEEKKGFPHLQQGDKKPFFIITEPGEQ